MATTRTAKVDSSPRNTTKELDIYAAEFAKLVDRYAPSRGDRPSDWLRRLPDEAYHYYQEGVSTFGSDARTPIERRGRLYLIHTALLFMWMNWGKTTARERFQSDPNEGTRRAASLITLERYRRAGVLAHYESNDWFSAPVAEWTVSLISGAVDPKKVRDDALRTAIQNQTTVNSTVGTFSKLRSVGAIPSRDALQI